MAAQIRPSRMAVTDRFPMLGFTVRVNSAPCVAEVVIATDPALFAQREGRTPSNFYTSREHGLLSISQAEVVFMLPPAVLARFVGANHLWYGLATADSPRAGNWTVDVLPGASSPYVSLSGLSDRALRRVRMFPGRGGVGSRGPVLDWAGDNARPGTTAVPARKLPADPADPSQAAAQPTPKQGDVHYDDGFGPLPPLNRTPPAALAPAPSPANPAPPVQPAPATGPRAVAAGLARQPTARAMDGDTAVEIKYRVFIPSPAIKGPPLFDNFAGDGRGFSYVGGTARGEITFTVDISDAGAASNLRIMDRHWSPTHAYSPSDTSPVADKPSWWLDLNAGAVPTDTATCPTNDNTLNAMIGAPGTSRSIQTMADPSALVTVRVAGNNPLITGSPDIDADVSVFLRRGSSGAIEARAQGSHDGFPAHELYVNGQCIYSYDPVAAGNDPTALFPPLDIEVNTRWTSVGAMASSASLAWARAMGADDAEAYGIDEPPYTADSFAGASAAAASALALTAAEYDGVTRTAPSPNFTAGRAGTAVDRIVIHITDGPSVNSAVNTFTNAASKVSAHYVVGQQGELVQLVSEADTAWHCKGSNRRGIGIEHVAIKAGGATYGSTHFDALAPTQLEYETSAALVAHLCDKYQLPVNRSTIMGHHEADPSSGHTSCPDGNWDWDYYMRLVTSRSCQAQGGATQSLGMRARALDADDWTINWDDVEMIAQPTDLGCWATAAAMVIGWRDRQSVDPTLLARCSGMDSSLSGGLRPQDKRAFATGLGLVVHPNACYTPDGFRQIVEANGPIWVTANVPFTHAIVVTGMYRQDGQYYVRITDPLDRVVGVPSAAGSYLSTHSTGSRYIMGWDAFTAEFEAAGNIDRIQIVHSGGTFGHTINRGSAAGVGYAQAADVPPSQSSDFGAGVSLTRRSEIRNAISYDLAQLSGLVQPADAVIASASQREAVVPRMPGQQITLDDWPYIDAPSGRISAPVAIDWAWQGGSVGDVAIAPVRGQMLDGWDAQVRADISRARETPGQASLCVRVTTTFRHAGEDDQVAVTEVVLNGNGRFRITHGADSAPPAPAVRSTPAAERQLEPA